MGIDYKLLRQTAGLSEEQLAQETGATLEQVRDWEAGKAAPDPMTLKKIFALVKKAAEKGQ